MDHMGHDHSAHAGMAESLDGPIPHPSHGGWLGHMLPGWFFFGWATWWLIGVFRLYMKSSVKAPYKARTWYDFPFSTRVPIEPLLKMLLTFVGINGELWFGHESWRYAPGGCSSYADVYFINCCPNKVFDGQFTFGFPSLDVLQV